MAKNQDNPIMSHLICIFYLFLCSSAMAMRTSQFPFLWFEDSFDTEQTNIWSKPPSDPFSNCWSASNGTLAVSTSAVPYCYMSPTFEFGAWKLPVASRIYGASVRLEGGGLPATACCANNIQLGVAALSLRRDLSNRIDASTSNGPCGSVTTSCRSGFCNANPGSYTEEWALNGGDTRSQISRSCCVGDVCFCNSLRPGATRVMIFSNLPSENYTTNIVSSADGTQITVTMLHAGGSWTIPNTGSLSLAGPNFTMAGIALVPSLSSGTDWFPHTALPETLSFRSFAVYLAGQCFDNNTVSGDGCDNTTYVERLCSCSRRQDLVWGLSRCTCARNATALQAIVNVPPIHIRDLSGSVVLGNYTEEVDIEDTVLSTIAFSRCPIPNLGCSSANTIRILNVIINGTLVGNMTDTPFVPVDLASSRQEWTMNMSRFGAPFPIGTKIQFIWWTNVNYPAEAGALHFDGPAISASPIYVIRPAYPIILRSGSSGDVAGGFNYHVNFSSTIRDPTRIELWLYQGSILHPPTYIYNFTEDSTLTRISANCSSAYTGPVLHSCNVSVPEMSQTNGIIVARLYFNYIQTPIMSTGIPAYKFPTVNVNARPTAADSRSLEFTGVDFDERCVWDITVNSTLIPSSVISQNNSYVKLNISGSMMAFDSDIFVTANYLGVRKTYLAGKTYYTLVDPITTPNQKIYFDDATFSINGTGFITGFPAEHRVLLRQIGVESRPVGTVIDAKASNITVKLSSRLPSGGLSVTAILLDGGPSVEVVVGFYFAYSMYDRVPLPRDLDLTVAPRVDFSIGSPMFENGPRPETIPRVERELFALTNISTGDVYTRLTYLRSSGSNYTLSIWFVTNRGASAFNALALPRNRTIVEAINSAVLLGMHPSFSCNISSSTEVIDPTWLFLAFGLTKTSAVRTKSPQPAELLDLVSFCKTLWRLTSADLTAVARPASEGYDYNVYVYFRTAPSQSFFLKSRLPFNESISPAETIMSDAFSREFSSKFLFGSPVPDPERQISSAWQWMKFLLQPIVESPPTDPTTVSARLSSALALLMGLEESGIYLRVTPWSSKRSIGDYDMFIYFTTPDAVVGLTSRNFPTDSSFLMTLSQTVANVTGQSYNATFIATSLAAPSSAAATDEPAPGFPVWQVSVGVVAAVLLLIAIIVISVVFYRRRFHALQNAKKAAAEITDEMASMFSIPASDIEILEKLGEGGFGAVYLGRWKGKRVAVKKLGSNLLSSQVADFFREFNLMAGLKPHRFVVRVFGMSQEIGNFSMVMELLQGGSLDKLLEKRAISPQNQLDPAELYNLARGIALGMRHLARCGIVHRDLAARNILLDAANTPKVSDFGLSRVIGDKTKGKTATLIGPVRWMAPENIGRLEYSEKSDVWSYGALLIELITGQVPFPGMELVNVATEVRDGRSTALTYLPPDVNPPAWIMQLIRMCFTFDDNDRPSFDDVVSFLTSHAPPGFELDPNEETPQEPATDGDDPKDRKRAGSRKASSAPPKVGTKYAAIKMDPSAVEMDELNKND